MIKFWLILPLLCISVYFKANGENPWSDGSKVKVYTKKELIVLCERSEYQEFFLHANDLSPSQRDDQWQSCLRSLSVQFLQRLQKQAAISQADLKKVFFLEKWKTNKDNDEFLKQREYLALSYFKSCFNKNKEVSFCQQDLDRFWHIPPTTPSITLQFSPFFRDKWPVFQEVLRSNRAEIYCLNPIIRNRLLEEVHKIKNDDSDSFILQVDALVHPSCWASFLPHLKQILATNSNKKETEKIRHILKLKNQISKEPKSVKLFENYFMKLSPGKELNLSWNFVQSLRKNKEVRDELIQSIVKRPLPSTKLFLTKDHFYKKTLLSHLQTSFPEFFEVYTSKCLESYALDKAMAKSCAKSIIQSSSFFNSNQIEKARLILPR